MTQVNNFHTVVIFGATSAIAQELAKLHAQVGDSLLLVARNDARLESINADLLIRGAKSVRCINFDLGIIEQHTKLMQEVEDCYSDINRYYFFYGVLPEQKECESSWQLTYEAINTNFLSKVSLLTHIANKIENETNRNLIVVSSVAGDRGRQSNYVYGTCKGALNIFLQGLRNRLQKSNCSVTTIKPGFVDTPMTRDFDKNFLWASPERVAKDIYAAANKRRNEIYSPWVWRYIMFIIKTIPEAVFKKLSL